MNKKIFLTSFIALGFACPAMAEHQTVSTFPVDEYMLEDYTYQNQATYTNMGVYEGSVSATADYTDNVYTLLAGQYLPANSETPTTCDQNGYYCAGNSNGVNYQSYAQGLTQCPNDYSNTANGASANTDCFRSCSTDDVAHSATVSGQMYYDGTSGDGVNACAAETCVSGWHVKTSTLADTIGNQRGISNAYIHNGIFREDSASYGQSYYGITSNTKAWAVYYGAEKGVLKGEARCSSVSGTGAWNGASSASDITTHTTAELGAEDGNNCYCNLTGYTLNGENTQNISSHWVLLNNFEYNGHPCNTFCTQDCSESMKNNSSLFSAALLESVALGPAMCEANTITINWADVDPEYAGDNNEGTATYGSDINTPFKAATKPGKTFRGWKFVKPSNNNNG